uniref:Uncharacterized protein n=1 Tax=uncultured bacterium Contig1529 TaxID=1393449 RepID=W0FM83_9BACT|nr:hypothetical protein [uncultured bacterium Contig1529]
MGKTGVLNEKKSRWPAKDIDLKKFL